MLEGRDPPPVIIREEVRRLHRHLTLAMAVMTVIAWAAALWAAARAPWVADLYHLINPGASPKGAQSTALYLFWYPSLLTAWLLTNAFAPDLVLSTGSKLRAQPYLPLVVGGLSALVFLGFSVFRAVAAGTLPAWS